MQFFITYCNLVIPEEKLLLSKIKKSFFVSYLSSVFPHVLTCSLTSAAKQEAFYCDDSFDFIRRGWNSPEMES